MEGVVSNKTLWGLRTSFAKSVAEMEHSEVFGIGCGEKWDCLFKDFLIIDVLKTYKKKCYNFCVKFDVITYNTGFYLVIDNINFTAVAGDSIQTDSESLDFLSSTYTIQTISQFPDINAGLYSQLLGLGYSTQAFVVDLGNTLTEETTGYMSLENDIQLSNDNRELTQEDLDCLIDKIC